MHVKRGINSKSLILKFFLFSNKTKHTILEFYDASQVH